MRTEVWDTESHQALSRGPGEGAGAGRFMRGAPPSSWWGMRVCPARGRSTCFKTRRPEALTRGVGDMGAWFLLRRESKADGPQGDAEEGNQSHRASSLGPHLHLRGLSPTHQLGALVRAVAREDEGFLPRGHGHHGRVHQPQLHDARIEAPQGGRVVEADARGVAPA